MPENIIFVDENDSLTGEMEKPETHQKTLLPLAVLVFSFISTYKLFLQKRSLGKYHSSGLWTKTAFTYSFPDASNEAAVMRRLKEEIGITLGNVTEIFHFIYKEQLENGLTAHEFDHVFVGFSEELPMLNPNEVSDFDYVETKYVLEHVELLPQNYTVWFKKIIDRVANEISMDNRIKKDRNINHKLFIRVMYVLFAPCAPIPKGVTAVSPYEKEKHLGKCYELARFDFRFERGLNNITADYSLNGNGSIKVVNRDYDFEKKIWKEAIGKAKFAGNEKVAMLKVSFFGPFYAGCKVIAIDPEYNYALVSGLSFDYLWIFSSEKINPSEINSLYREKAEKPGYKVSKILRNEHDN